MPMFEDTCCTIDNFDFRLQISIILHLIFSLSRYASKVSVDYRRRDIIWSLLRNEYGDGTLDSNSNVYA